MAVLEVKNIGKHFGATEVLADVSFDLEEGSALAIIGSSGSGKTTLLRCLNFLETPDRGSITVRGKPCLTRSIPSKGRRRICAPSGCISAWCFRRSTCFHSIRR